MANHVRVNQYPEIEAERIRQLYARGPKALATSLVAALISAGVLWQVAPPIWVGVWLVVQSGVSARRLGRIHAAVGVDRRWLIQSYGLWLDGLQAVFAREPLRLRLAQPVLARRLARETEFELEGYAETERARDQVRDAIEELAWHAECYADLIEGAVLALLGLEEVAAATIARPDAAGVLQYEAVAGEPFRRYLKLLEAGKIPPIRIDSEHPEGRATGGEAWRSGEIRHASNYATDSRLTPWRKLARSLGVRSLAAVPLRIKDAPVALLLIYSSYPGGYTGSAQQTLLEHLQRVLSLGLERLRRTPRVQATPERRRYRRLLAAGGLEMLYQPVVDLRRGELVKLDQGLVRSAAADPLRVLGFIARMTDLAREAGARVVVEGLESPGLIEAAAILGADLGQGYAIARPLGAAELPAWAKTHLPLALEPTRPRTALGVLAESIRWDQRLAAVAAWPQIIRQLAAQPCAERYYLHTRGLDASPLGQAHAAMHTEVARDATLRGAAYQRLRKHHLTLLVAHATAEENKTE